MYLWVAHADADAVAEWSISYILHGQNVLVKHVLVNMTSMLNSSFTPLQMTLRWWLLFCRIWATIFRVPILWTLLLGYLIIVLWNVSIYSIFMPKIVKPRWVTRVAPFWICGSAFACDIGKHSFDIVCASKIKLLF